MASNNLWWILLLLFESGFYYVVLVSLELAMYARLALNSEKSTCLCLSSVGIKDVPHHTGFPVHF